MSSPEYVPGGRPGALRPGSLLWLLHTQLRVTWRALPIRRLRVLLLLGMGLLVLGAAVLAPRLWALRAALSGVTHLGGFALLLLGGVSAFVFLLMLSAAISATLEALYERGDLDLLLGAPVRPRTVLASRLLAVAVSAGTVYVVLAVPVLVFALAAGLWRLLGVLPWLVSLSLTAASLGALVTLGLVRALGVRRARTAASIVGALSGAAFFLLTQYQNLRGQSAAPLIGQDVFGPLQAALQGGGPLGEGSVLWYPARAVWLEPLPTVLLLAASVALFALSVTLLEGAFQRGAQQAGMHGAPLRRGQAARFSGPLRFRAGRSAVLVKEWRLLARDPLLLSRILLQVVYLLPLGLVLLRTGGAGAVVGSGGVLVLGSLSGSLALITTNAEEAPDLLLSAPTTLTRLRWLKLLSAVLPVLAVWLLLNTGALLRTPGLPAALGAVLGLWSIVGSGLIVLWRPLEVRRADLFRQGGQRGDLMITVSTLLMQGGLLLALFTLPRGTWPGWLGLALATAGPLLSLSRRQTTAG